MFSYIDVMVVMAETQSREIARQHQPLPSGDHTNVGQRAVQALFALITRARWAPRTVHLGDNAGAK